MTLDEAKKIRDLLEYRDALKRDLDTIKRCESITGNINEGCNGLGFRWDKSDDIEIRYLIDGYEADIAKIDKLLFHLASPNFPSSADKANAASV